jgi:PKD repeat protein
MTKAMKPFGDAWGKICSIASLFLIFFLVGCQVIDVSFTLSKAKANVGESITFTPNVTILDNNGSQGSATTYDAQSASAKDTKKALKNLDRLEWNFGDGVTRTTSSESPITHTFSVAGTYTVTLTAYDNQGNSDSASKTVVIVKPDFFDHFLGQSISLATWNPLTYLGYPSNSSVADSVLTLNNCEFMTTQGKYEISQSNKVVLEARLRGPKSSGRDTHFGLVDTSEQTREIRFGDTNYSAWGTYLQVVDLDANSTPFYRLATSYGGTTDSWTEYRMTIVGSHFVLERGASLATITERFEGDLGISISGRTWYVRVGTGGCDGFYSPGEFDWIRVRTE